jgi:glycosyltransferase involved in cell wall biosynthesis
MSGGRRRLLAVSWEMPPLSGPRAVQVSRTLKHLVPLGWESSVVCFGAKSQRYFPDADLAARLAPGDGVRIVPVPSREEHLRYRVLWRVAPQLKGRPDEKQVWIAPATDAALRLAAETRFDAIATFAQPWSDHLVGRALRRELKLPWVAHFSDPWVDSPYHFPEWQRQAWAPMERAVVEDADALVFVNAQTAERVMRKYPEAWRSKVHVVPHGHDADMLPARPSVPPKPDTSGALRLVYTGRFYAGWRTPEHLLNAVFAITRQDATAVQLTIAGAIDGESVVLAEQLKLDNEVNFLGRLSWEESIRTAMSADVLLVVDAPSEVNLFLPSKLIEYLPLGKPILGLTPAAGASADVLRALGYPIVPPDDAAAIERALRGLVAAKRAGTLAASPQHRAVAARYDIRQTTAEFAAVLNASIGSA